MLGLFRKFAKKFQIKHTIKTKLTLVFISIILILGSINIISYTAMNSAEKKLSTIVDATEKINSIIVETKNISQNTEKNNNSYYINSYRMAAAVNPENAESIKYKKLVLNSLSKVEGLLNSLSMEYSNEKSMKDSLDETKTVFLNFKDTIDTTFTNFEKKDISQTFTSVDSIAATGEFFVSSAQDVMSAQLEISKGQKESLNKQSALTGIIIVVTVIFVAFLSILAAYLITGRITGTISRLAAIFERLADGDLRVEKINVRSKDEVAVLSGAFNSMTQSLKALISEIAESSSKVMHLSELFKVGADQNSSAIELVAKTMQELSVDAENQSKQSQETLDVITEVLEGSKKISGSANNVLSTSDKATSVALTGNEKMKNLLNQISAIEDKMSGIQTSTNELRTQTGEIKKILDTISKIASQSGLLALNASIEAARAGEHGKSFSIVANEIAKLAAECSTATTEITKKLVEIQKQSEIVDVSMSSGVDEVKKGTILADESQKYFEKILETSSEVENQVSLITMEIDKMTGEIEKVETLGRCFTENALRSSEGSQSVSAVVEEQTANLQEIAASSSELLETAEGLKSAIHRFKL